MKWNPNSNATWLELPMGPLRLSSGWARTAEEAAWQRGNREAPKLERARFAYTILYVNKCTV